MFGLYFFDPELQTQYNNWTFFIIEHYNNKDGKTSSLLYYLLMLLISFMWIILFCLITLPY